MARQTDRAPSEMEIWRGRLLSILILAVAAGVAFSAARDAYAGISTGCIKAKYGFLCRGAAPVRFWMTTMAAALVSLVSLGVCTVAALFLRLWLKARL